MIGKKLSKILAAVMAVAMLGGCGKAQVPSASGGVLKETAPAVTEAPVLNDPGERHYRTFGYYYCIHNDGTVSIRDDDYYESGFTKVTVPGWSDIVSVVYDYRNFVGLKSDGTIVTTAPDDESYQVLKSWKDIVSIHSNDYSDGIIGLSAAGEVFCSADSSVITQWKEIVQLEAQYSGTFGLKADGTVVSEDPAVDLSGWTDVTQLALGSAFVAGLRRDGTVLMAPLYGDYEDPMLEQQMAEVSRWTDVVKLSAYQELMGLRSDGTVLATNAVVGEFAAYFDSDMDFSSWRGKWFLRFDIVTHQTTLDLYGNAPTQDCCQ